LKIFTILSETRELITEPEKVSDGGIYISLPYIMALNSCARTASIDLVGVGYARSLSVALARGEAPPFASASNAKAWPFGMHVLATGAGIRKTLSTPPFEKSTNTRARLSLIWHTAIS